VSDKRGSDCDVLVVGGGPAGLATVLELRRLGSLSVLVVERGGYDVARIGETLSPGAGTLLAHLGVPTDLEADGHVRAYGTAAAWGRPALSTRDFLMTPYGTGWHLDRRRFDARLAEAAEQAGAAVWCRSRLRRMTDAAEGFAAEVEHDGEVHRLHPGFVVDATGKSASVARRLATRRQRLDRQVAVAAIFTFDRDPPTDSVTVVEACELGWWYTANLPDRRLVTALITDADIVRSRDLARRSSWSQALQRTEHTGRRTSTGNLSAGPRVIAAYSACLTPTVGTRWLAVGDAAASHDPLSSSGIVRALESGIQAGVAIDAALGTGRTEALRRYDDRRRLAYEQYLATRAGYYQMECRWPDAPFWRRRQRQVTLSPSRRVGPGVNGADTSTVQLPADLGHVDVDVLVALAAAGRPAHEIVTRYRAQTPQAVTDLEMILALQWLLACGTLRPLADAPDRGP
jgi:flavin-dependent dehydrogenase